jgi:hypothetical protein
MARNAAMNSADVCNSLTASHAALKSALAVGRSRDVPVGLTREGGPEHARAKRPACARWRGHRVGRLDGQLAALRHGVSAIDGEIKDRAFKLARIGVGSPQHAGQDSLNRD